METIAGKYQLTELGFEIVDPAQQKDAMVRAFLNVELYKKVFDEFKGKQLPPRPHGLEAAFVRLGVRPKQKDRARTAFDKSARAAGFFPNGNEDRLVMPFGMSNGMTLSGGGDEDALDGGITVVPATPTVPVHPSSPGIHKSILGMLDELPPSKTEWEQGSASGLA